MYSTVACIAINVGSGDVITAPVWIFALPDSHGFRSFGDKILVFKKEFARIIDLSKNISKLLCNAY